MIFSKTNSEAPLSTKISFIVEDTLKSSYASLTSSLFPTSMVLKIYIELNYFAMNSFHNLLIFESNH